MSGTYGQTGVTYGQAGGTYGGWGTAAAGGRLRPVKSAAQQRQIQRFVRFRWTLLVAVSGQVTSQLTAPRPAAHFTARHVQSHTRITAASPKATVRIHAHTFVKPPAAQLLPPDDLEELIIFDLA